MSGTAEAPVTAESGAPPSDDGDPVHLLDPDTDDVALCGIKIVEWVTASEYSKRPCKCCIRERMAKP